MKKFTKDITSVLAALTAGAVAAVPGSIILQGSSANAETDSTAETTTSVSRVMAVPGSSTADDNSIEEQGPFTEGFWDIVGDMAPVDECTVTEIPDIDNTPTAGVPLISDELIPDVTTVTELPPVGGVPLVSDELIPDVPAVTEMPPLAGEPLPPDDLIPELPDDTEMPPYEGGMMLDDRFVPDEKGRTLSLIKIRVYDVHFKYFLLDDYMKTLISEGMSEEEADKKCMSLYDEYMSRGVITNAAADKAYREYLSVVLMNYAKDILDDVLTEKDRELKISYDYPEAYSVSAEVKLSGEEFERAEKSDYVISVQNADEIMRFGGKLDDVRLLEALRNGEKTVPVEVNINDYFDNMSDDDAVEYFRNLSGVSGPVTVMKDAKSAIFSTELNYSQIEELSYNDRVKGFIYSYQMANGGLPPATNPADDQGKIVKGDINSDGITDITDLSMLSLYILGDRGFTEEQMKLADVDGDGSAELPDLAKMKQYLSKIIEKL